MLLYDGAIVDPRVRRLDAPAAMFWLALLGQCSKRQRETLGIDEVDEVMEVRRAHGKMTERDVLLDELVEAELVERLPHEHVRLLAHLDLWAFDDEADYSAEIGRPE